MLSDDSQIIQGFLYTTKEQKMHVYGPKTLVSDEILRNLPSGHKISDGQAENFLERGFFQVEGLVDSSLLRKARE